MKTGKRLLQVKSPRWSFKIQVMAWSGKESLNSTWMSKFDPLKKFSKSTRTKWRMKWTDWKRWTAWTSSTTSSSPSKYSCTCAKKNSICSNRIGRLRKKLGRTPKSRRRSNNKLMSFSKYSHLLEAGNSPLEIKLISYSRVSLATRQSQIEHTLPEKFQLTTKKCWSNLKEILESTLE